MPSKQDNGKRERYRIAIDGEWSLQDLYVFPHAYNQLYSFVFSVTQGRLDVEEDEEWPRFDYPWRGGWSTVNFFEFAAGRMGSRNRPELLAIHYESPGWLDLGLLLSAAYIIRKLVRNFVATSRELLTLYNDIYKGLHDREMMRIDARERLLSVEQKELEWLETSANKMAELLGFEDLPTLARLTGNPIATLKLMLALYRRVRTLAKFKESGKADV